MIDIGWNFVTNDFDTVAGDFKIINLSSQQNGAMIFNKSVSSLSQAQIGVGFEEIYPNMSPMRYDGIAVSGEKQIIQDGAQDATIEIFPIGHGDVKVDIEARYRE